jgi:hypothetical protein
MPSRGRHLILAAVIGVVAVLTTGMVGLAGAASSTVSVAKTVVGVVEGNSGTTAASVTVTLGPASSSTVTVHYATVDGTAKVSDNDYVATSGTLTFAPGQTTKVVTVPVVGDTKLEDYELLGLTLSSPTNATLGNATEKIQIRNDEIPQLTLANVKANEGSPAVFRPKLKQAYYAAVTLTAQTHDGTATTPSDYAAVNRSVVVPAGSKTAPTVGVDTVADGTTEPAETFTLSVSSPSVVAGLTKTATIGSQLCRTAATPAHYQHVVVVVMENKRYGDVIGNAGAPWLTSIARGCATATRYQAVSSPSRPNYIAMTAGNIFDCAGSDADPVVGNCHPTSPSLFEQVIDAGGTAVTYAEGMSGNCDAASHGTYAVKHNPWVYFSAESSLCAQYDQPMPAAIDAAHLPTLLVVIPDQCNDTHNCSVATGDTWLRQHLQPVLDSPAYLDGSTAVIVTYDEYTYLPNVFASQSVKPGVKVGTTTSHYGFLRTVEDMLGLSPLGQAATAASLRTAMHL